MTNAERIVSGIIETVLSDDVRTSLKNDAVAERVCASLGKYMYTERMSLPKTTHITNWLATYLTFVSEKSVKPLVDLSPWAWYALICYASTFAGDSDWRKLTTLGMPNLKLESLPIMEDDSETEIEILKRCKEVCCNSVEQGKKGSVC